MKSGLKTGERQISDEGLRDASAAIDLTGNAFSDKQCSKMDKLARRLDKLPTGPSFSGVQQPMIAATLGAPLNAAAMKNPRSKSISD